MVGAWKILGAVMSIAVGLTAVVLAISIIADCIDDFKTGAYSKFFLCAYGTLFVVVLGCVAIGLFMLAIKILFG